MSGVAGHLDRTGVTRLRPGGRGSPSPGVRNFPLLAPGIFAAPMSGDEHPFHLAQESVDGRRRVAVSGEIDLQTAPELEAALSEACAAGRTIELDLHEVSFIDSTGIRAILAAKASCAQHEVELLMVPSRHPAPRRVFELSGLLDRLPWRARRD